MDRKVMNRTGWKSVIALAVALLVGVMPTMLAAGGHPRTFPTAEAASAALQRAVAKNDERTVEAILGIGTEVTAAAAGPQDKLERALFTRKYREMHRLVVEPEGFTVLYIGAENWPFPVPLVQKNGRWSFDSKAGAEEILLRRVGENEATALQFSRDLAAAAKTGSAQELKPSTEPFHGYYLRAMSTTDGGDQTGSLAYVLYPAAYRASGVMTFIVSRRGEIYERDLGANTGSLALQLQDWPASGWTAVQ
jgi:hypothetical protein